MSENKVVGHIAYRSRDELYCDGKALVVAGSFTSMQRMLALAGVPDARLYTIKKARFDEILDGMRRGGAYAFDVDAYGRYATAARDAGVTCSDYDFSTSNPDEIKLVTISIA